MNGDLSSMVRRVYLLSRLLDQVATRPKIFGVDSEAVSKPLIMNAFYPSRDDHPDNTRFYSRYGAYPLVIVVHEVGTSKRSCLIRPLLVRGGMVVAVPDTDVDVLNDSVTDCIDVIA